MSDATGSRPADTAQGGRDERADHTRAANRIDQRRHGDDALVRARQVLAAGGLDFDVDRAGPGGALHGVAAPPGRIDDVRACAPQLRKLGFRYVTIEIVPDA